jgi:hypothetical protein
LVKIYLPHYFGELEGEAPGSDLSDAHQAEAGETVLAVEDEPVVRCLILEVLDDLG